MLTLKVLANQRLFLVLGLFIFQYIVTTTNAVDIPQHLKAQAKKLHDRCQKQSGVSEELIRQAHDGNIPNDGNLKCYIHCLFDMVGLIDENQIVHLENIMEILPTESHAIIQNLVDKCGTKKGVDACDTAYQTVQCYFNADPISLKSTLDFFFN